MTHSCFLTGELVVSDAETEGVVPSKLAHIDRSMTNFMLDRIYLQIRVSREEKNLAKAIGKIRKMIQAQDPEKAYYDSLYSIVGPDITGHVSGKPAADFFSKSGLSRDLLHKIWALADTGQEGRLNRESFHIACRLIAHAQNGNQVDLSAVSTKPSSLPIFTDLSRRDPLARAGPHDDVISLSDAGVEWNAQRMDPSRSFNIISNLARSGLDPLDFVPFESGLDVPRESQPTDWTITESNRQKYSQLFRRAQPDAAGRIDGKACREILQRSGLPKETLASIWEHSDADGDGFLDESEFVLAMHLTTMCKKGFKLPQSLPQQLLDQLSLKGGESPRFGGPILRPQAIPSHEAWKYSRSYLTNLPGAPIDLAVSRDLEEVEEEVLYNFDSCSQVESDIRRMASELERRKLLIAELTKSKAELSVRKINAAESRKSLNIDKISLRRDRTKLQSELDHLKKILQENTCDVQRLRQSIRETELDTQRILDQSRSLELQRREAMSQHIEEVNMIDTEQRETSRLIEGCKRSDREREVFLESKRLEAEKAKVLDGMQRDVGGSSSLRPASIFGESNKWATEILRPKSARDEESKRFGFGTSFFNSTSNSPI
jgi:hypothetical protein